MNTFILAAGDATRWKEEVLFPQYSLKQLVRIGNDVLIKRTLKQVKNSYLVTHDPILSKTTQNIINPIDRRFTASTLYSTRDYWKDERIVVLLGDVVYSKEAISKIIKCDKPFAVLGSDVHGEIYALSFTNKNKVLYHLEIAIKDAENGGRGKLWEMYRSYIGADLKDHIYDYDVFVNIDDGFTRDFDTQQQYAYFLQQYPKIK